VRALIFTASEILQFAVKIEQNGEALYRTIAERTAEPTVRKLFLFLAKEDLRHAGIFGQMLSEVEKFEPMETYPGEYAAYMNAYTAEIIFPATVIRELPPSTDPIAALDFGIRRELDSITYYMHAKDLVPPNHAEQLDQIIAEERKHFIKFSEMKRRFLRKRAS